ncbi:hypothetical protein S245_010438 [Arachis hypogaea]
MKNLSTVHIIDVIVSSPVQTSTIWYFFLSPSFPRYMEKGGRQFTMRKNTHPVSNHFLWIRVPSTFQMYSRTGQYRDDSLLGRLQGESTNYFVLESLRVGLIL